MSSCLKLHFTGGEVQEIGTYGNGGQWRLLHVRSTRSKLYYADNLNKLIAIQEIEAGQHQVLLTSPEMCLEHVKFSKLLRTP